MAYQSINSPEPLLMSPPLHPPLVLRSANGMFGARRGDEDQWAQCQPCNRFEPAPSPNQDYVKWQIHEAIDLEGDAGDCVFAAYAGTIVDTTSIAGGTMGTITIDHHETGLGLVSRYLHLEGNSICVTPGMPVTKGQVLAQLSSAPMDPHLHFELRNVIDPAAAQFWEDKNSIPIDPTRLLYRWEAQVLPTQSAASAVAVDRLGTQVINNIALFQAEMDNSDIYSIPLYEPMTEHERHLIMILEKAFDTGRQVEVEYRDSVYFGNHRIPVSVRIV
jgi:peptidase M23-like protein